jgi:hypothetical protein
VTKVISRTNFAKVGQTVNEANAFVNRVRGSIPNFAPSSIWNTDQSAFEKERMGSHTLEVKGTREVTAIVQSVSSTTHSYTVQPSISLDGKLMKPLFIILQEKDGKFPVSVAEKMYKHPEIHVVASKSGKITKDILMGWYKNVFKPNAGANNLLIFDALTTYNNIKHADADMEEEQTCQMEMIPAGATGICQPLDLYFFRILKAFHLRISNHVIIEGLDWRVFQRDNILKLMAAIHHQFRSPRFTGFIKYAWYKSGYVDEKNDHITPSQFCFDTEVSVCEFCPIYSLLKCGWCKRSFRFNHFVATEVHMCENFIP